MESLDLEAQREQSTREIKRLEAEVSRYRQRSSMLWNTILQHSDPSDFPAAKDSRRTKSAPNIAAAARAQRRRNQESAYRLGAGITAFRVRDPDPNAVDGGAVLGVRIEQFDAVARAFVAPYYVFFNRPDGSRGGMRVHRHTVPPYVMLGNLVKRYLPYQQPNGDVSAKQDIAKFARALRRELVAAMKRRNAVDLLSREAAGVGGLDSIKATNEEAREVEISWADGAVGRFNVDTDGVVTLACVAAAGTRVGGRMRQRERAIRGGDARLEGVVQRLAAQEPQAE